MAEFDVNYLKMAHEDAARYLIAPIPGTLRFEHRPPLWSRLLAPATFLPADYLVYPFLVLALLPLPLIEQRYGLFPLVWIMLNRRRQEDDAERDNRYYGAAFSIAMLIAVATESFFF